MKTKLSYEKLLLEYIKLIVTKLKWHEEFE